nr:MAG TPA: hypothetical protein [Caudoviricetes sp.]
MIYQAFLQVKFPLQQLDLILNSKLTCRIF